MSTLYKENKRDFSMTFNWKKKLPFGSGNLDINLNRILIIFSLFHFCRHESLYCWVSLKSLGVAKVGLEPQPSLRPGPPGLVLGLLNSLNSFWVFSLSWFKCCSVLQENGSMMCLYFYCRKMDLVVWGRWGNGPQLLRRRKASGKYSGWKAVCIIKQ